MFNRIKNYRVFLILILPVLSTVYCNKTKKPSSEAAEASPYLNHADSVKYVGINTCKLCHQDIYNTFIHTGMGQSFAPATRQKSAARFEKNTAIKDRFLDLCYHPFWDKDSLKIKEFRLEGNDTVYQRIEKVDYVVGSGQHTNSHIFNTNGYLHQMPMTFYTQDGHWDFPPGFENGFNSRFSRKIGLECMTCHNSLPDFVPGSENKYFSVGEGINCERCHGPGGEHVKRKSAGIIVDTSKYIDYSIVNPGKLPVDLQFDVCQRCHLQGNAVLKEGKSFYDFKPGMKLSDVISVFLAKYEHGEKDFIMASHADRLKMSQCFIKSFKPTDKRTSLRPYKQSMTCVTCHNPHVSVKVTGHLTFDNACKNCHGNSVKVNCSEKQSVRAKVGDDCVKCHMPRSGSIDIPHVTVTDHFIRKPVSTAELVRVKRFIGLFSINEKNPDRVTRAKAYLQQYEKFDAKAEYLDSAKRYLPDQNKEEVMANFENLVNLAFLKNDPKKIISYVSLFDRDYLLNSRLNKKSWDNRAAWTCYRIGEAYQQESSPENAFAFFDKAVELAPFNNDFKNKKGAVLMDLKRNDEAKKVFQNIIAEDPKYASAYINLGYIYFTEKDLLKADVNYNKVLQLNPDNEIALGNKINLYVVTKQYDRALQIVKKLIKKDPGNQRLKEMEKQLSGMI